MFLRELMERMKYRALESFNSEKRVHKVISRAVALACAAAVVTTIAPTLADELATSPEMIQQVEPVSNEVIVDSETVTAPETETETATPEPTPEPVIFRPRIASAPVQILAEGDETQTVEDLPPAPLEIQPRFTLKIPATAAVDPRATSLFFPYIYASQDSAETDFTMVCIRSQGISFDIKNKRAADDQSEGNLLVSGDLSSRALVSGTTNQVLNLLNSNSGIFAYSTGGAIPGRGVTFEFVAVTKPVVDPNFCAAARSGAVTTVRALALELSTVKGSGRLK